MKILVFDDERIQVGLYLSLLRQIGVDLESVLPCFDLKSLKSMAKRIEHEEPFFVITDYNVGESKSGPRLVNEVLQEKKGRRFVICISAQDSSDVRREVEQETDMYIVKGSVAPDVLEATLKASLRDFEVKITDGNEIESNRFRG
ncbi:MAG: response regulator [Candidatus Dojkabacteria bacterium]|nr:MAG: response regulator [Candidatus Dojkabacteria bacterium]